jgi:uncharacterized protein YceK
MVIKWMLSLAISTSVLSGCSSTVNQSITQSPKQKFESKAGCVRTESPDKFDSRCDIPLLGYSGFSGI